MVNKETDGSVFTVPCCVHVLGEMGRGGRGERVKREGDMRRV